MYLKRYFSLLTLLLSSYQLVPTDNDRLTQNWYFSFHHKKSYLKGVSELADPWNKCSYFLKFCFQLRFLLKHSPKTGILVQFHFYIILDQNYLLYEFYWKFAHYPQNTKAMLSIPRKLVLPTGTLKQNFWGNEFLVSATKGTHVSVSGTCSRFCKRKDL